MSVSRRPRTGTRRDGGVRIIRTDEVRYPGSRFESTDAPGTENGAARQTLRPARDTGLALEGRRSREARRRAAQRRQQTIAGILTVVVLGALAWGWQYSSDRRAKAQPLTGLPSTNVPIAGDGTEALAQPVARAATAPASPTPLLASYRDLQIRLPVSVASLTEVGFHQASYPYAVRLKTKLPDADATAAKKDKSTHRDKAAQGTGADAWLTGEVLRMWRPRPGKPDTAADVGARSGSDVFAPVSGTVVKVKHFKLYDKYADVEIHIQPDGYPKLDLVMIHLSDVSCSPGDRVYAGLTRIAAVRKIDRRVASQLRSYTKNKGYHTHIQLNDATYPKYKGLEGAITVRASSATSPPQPVAR